MGFSAWVVPLLITGLFGWGLCSGVDVFDCFLKGAGRGTAHRRLGHSCAGLSAYRCFHASRRRRS